MYREQSKYKDHPRITWFGIGGTVAYVDYAGASEPYAYFIGGNGQGAFVVVPYLAAGEEDEQGGFTSIDEGIGYALARCDEQCWKRPAWTLTKRTMSMSRWIAYAKPVASSPRGASGRVSHDKWRLPDEKMQDCSPRS
jgi:hypothetical protein